MKQLTGLLLLAAVAACRDAPAASSTAASSTTARAPVAPASTTPSATGSSSGAPTTTPWPSDPCSWIPAATVEAIVGPLAGPPTKYEGGCRYPLKPDADVLRRREVAAKLEAASREMARKTGSNPDPFAGRNLPSEPAVIIDVKAVADPAGEVGLKAGTRRAAGWANLDSSAAGEERNATWDFSQSPIAIGLPGFLGRVGQVTVMARPEVINIPKDKLSALAAAVVRDLPDRPYGPPAGIIPGTSRGADPCIVLSAAEAEAVLGKLVVAPYRVSDNGVWPDPGGKACAYQAARQRVLRVEPVWSDAASEVQLTAGIGRLTSAMLGTQDPAAADTLEGPWDQAVADAASGALLFVKGDRALRVWYMLSSTNAKGAVELARKGLDNLATAR